MKVNMSGQKGLRLDIVSLSPEDAGIAGPQITAVTVTSTGGATLKLVPRVDGWTPPTDVRSNVLVTRFPVPFKCP